MSTHCLKEDRPQSVSPEECTLEARPTHFLQKNGKNMHIQNSASKKNANSPSKIIARVCALEGYTMKCKEAYFKE